MQLKKIINELKKSNNTFDFDYKNDFHPSDDIPDDAHLIHMWEPLHFSINKNYKYVNTNPIFLFFSDLLYIIIFPILWLFNTTFYGFKIYRKS